MNFFSKLFQNQKSKNNEPEKSFDEIYADLGVFEYLEDGFKFTNKDFSTIIKWSDIDQIDAYMKDVFAYDLIVLEIAIGKNILTINEETPGWFQLVLKLKEVFKTIPKDWNIKIIQPAFKANYTTLYKKT